MEKGLISLLFLLLSMSVYAQNGKIEGKVVDEKGEGLIGASVLLESAGIGVKTDLDGKFILKKLSDGKYTILISYIGYDKKSVSDIVVKQGNAELLNISLNKTGKGLKEVVVKTQVKKETINALMIQQKNLSTISDGISAELIRRTPDRNTGDVLKRVSGVSIAENKFAVIRGLADRYNLAMLNGDVLPSSEADRKAFSFDLIPSNLIDNITIVKAATPDRPAEFAGGIIDINTRDIPTDNFLNIQIGTGMNTISTFKPYYDSKNSKTDWLGFDKSMRVIPAGFPTQQTLQQPNSEFGISQRVTASKLFENTWGASRSESMLPFRSLQMSGGYVHRINKDRSWGIMGAVSYNRNQRTYEIKRNEVNGNTIAYDFDDRNYRDNVLIGSMLNLGVKLNSMNRITFKNSFTINSDDQTIMRSGDFKDNEYFVRGQALWFANNQLLSNQLNAEHIIGKRKVKLQWGLGRQAVTRNIPDLRRSVYNLNYDAQDTIYRANITTFPNTFFMGRFFAKTKEQIYSGNADVSFPYTMFKSNHTVKAGVYAQQKDRDYQARVLAYVRAKSAGFQTSLLSLPEQEMFNQDNMRDNGFILSDASQPMDQYTASSNLQAAYIMNDNLFAEKFRLVYGVRVERFVQELVTGNLNPGDLVIKKDNTNFLPSLNVTYLLNKKTNIRLCASQTLSRPEFRELSPASFYDYNLSTTFRGNPDLEQTRIYNYDLRYEYFQGKGEMISGSVFYKRFVDPIETAIPYGLTTTQKVFSYVNAPDATSYGVELEFRKSLAFLATSEKSALNNLVFFGNLAYIHSRVNITTPIAGGGELTYSRPMQGQSPYLINAGINFTEPVLDMGVTLVYNRIGERIFAVGNGEIPELYEAPRNVLDFSISKRLAKKWEVKLTVSDILSNPFVFYYNIDDRFQIVKENYAYQKGKDFDVIRIRPGTNIGLSVSYQFSK